MYEWPGIERIPVLQAAHLFTDNSKEVFLLYDDDTEGLAQSISEIIDHHLAGGEFGIERTYISPKEFYDYIIERR